MSHAMQRAVLVLNASYEPIHICGARRALVLLVKDAALVQEHTGREVYAGIMMPSVIRLKRYRRVPSRVQVLTRKNILVRDGYKCQYCAESLPASEATLDHVIPRAQGGKSVWENLVACCSRCNRRKADRTPAEAEMPLLSQPRAMTIHTSRSVLRSLGGSEEQWRKYLYYESEGDSRFASLA